MARAVDLIASQGVHNAEAIVRAAVAVGLEVAIAAAIIQKESNGRNIYGHDRGGVFSTAALGKPADNQVTEATFRIFAQRVANGETSNGVGPAQITWPNYFSLAERRGIRMWVPEDNIRFGLNVFANHLRGSGDVVEAGRAYNGARQYGVDLARMVSDWRQILEGASYDTLPASAANPIDLGEALRKRFVASI